MDALSPDKKPAFVEDQELDDKYPGCVEPTFDHELDEAYKTDASEALDSEGTRIPDIVEGPVMGIRERWNHVARLYALGKRISYISKFVGYSETGVSRIIREPWVQERVRHYRHAFDHDVINHVKDMAIDGAQRIHHIILDETEKTSVVLDASKWAIEKATGKPGQQVNIESNTLAHFSKLLEAQLKAGTPVEVFELPSTRETKEVSQTIPQLEDSGRWDEYLDQVDATNQKSPLTTP